MARIDIPALTQGITRMALEHPHDLQAHLMAHLGASRRAISSTLAKLVAGQWLLREGSMRRPGYRPGALRQVVRRYALSGLDEDLPWVRDFAACFDLPAAVRQIAQHAFAELLNNAIDHSGGSQVTVSMRQTPAHLQLLVSDDGRGLFDKIQEAFAIDEPSTAMLELSKGKLTSAPDRHTGRGLYFTSLLADVFDLHANQTAYQRRGWDARGWLPGRALHRQGTSIYVAIALDTHRTLDTILRAHSADGQGHGFERTRVPLHLLTDTHTGLESRAQARRVASRLPQFRCAEFDFQGIAEVGHGFVDELFRVFGSHHPDVELIPLNMNPCVASMINSVRSGSAA